MAKFYAFGFWGIGVFIAKLKSIGGTLGVKPSLAATPEATVPKSIKNEKVMFWNFNLKFTQGPYLKIQDLARGYLFL